MLEFEDVGSSLGTHTVVQWFSNTGRPPNKFSRNLRMGTRHCPKEESNHSHGSFLDRDMGIREKARFKILLSFSILLIYTKFNHVFSPLINSSNKYVPSLSLVCNMKIQICLQS